MQTRLLDKIDTLPTSVQLRAAAPVAAPQDARQRRRDAAIGPTQDAIATAPPGSFENYKAVPDKPGFYRDPFGHLKYIPPGQG